jgi:hypothetical protein
MVVVRGSGAPSPREARRLIGRKGSRLRKGPKGLAWVCSIALLLPAVAYLVDRIGAGNGVDSSAAGQVAAPPPQARAPRPSGTPEARIGCGDDTGSAGGGSAGLERRQSAPLKELRANGVATSSAVSMPEPGRLILKHTKRDGLLVIAEFTSDDAPSCRFRLSCDTKPVFNCSLGVSVQTMSPGVWRVEMQNPNGNTHGGATVEIYGCNAWLALDFSDAPEWCRRNCSGLDGLRMNHGVVRAFAGIPDEFPTSEKRAEVESTTSGPGWVANGGGTR